MVLVPRFAHAAAYPFILGAALFAGCVDNGTNAVPAQGTPPEARETGAAQDWNPEKVLQDRDWTAAADHFLSLDRIIYIEAGSVEHKILRGMMEDREPATGLVIGRVHTAYDDELRHDLLDQAVRLGHYYSVEQILEGYSEYNQTIRAKTPEYAAALAILKFGPPFFIPGFLGTLKMDQDSRDLLLAEASRLVRQEEIDALLAAGARFGDDESLFPPSARAAAMERAIHDDRLTTVANLLAQDSNLITIDSAAFRGLDVLIAADRRHAFGAVQQLEKKQLTQDATDALLATAAKAGHDFVIEAFLARNPDTAGALKLLSQEGFPAIEGFRRLQSYQAMLELRKAPPPAPAP